MKLTSTISVLAIAPLLTSTVAPSDTISFQTRALEVGEHRTDVGNMEMNNTIELFMGGQLLQTMEQSQSESDEVRITILAIDGDQVLEVELYCAKNFSIESSVAGETRSESPLVGKTISATCNDGDVEITDDQGQPAASDVEAAAVDATKRMFENQKSEFARVLPERPIEIGESFEVADEEARRIFSAAMPGIEIGLTLTLERRRDHEGPGLRCVRGRAHDGRRDLARRGALDRAER